MTFSNVVVIDCRGHLMGRMASVIAKELLSGQKVVAVRCELLEISGAMWRNRIKQAQFVKKRTATNPKRGPIHVHSPARMLWRVVRGMIPHKTQRGNEAMLRFKSFEGVPHPYDRVKKMVIPDALRTLRLRPGRKFTVLGDLAQKFGWKHADIIETLEEKRKTKSAAFYSKKKELLALKAQAAEAADLSKVNETLAQYGY
uniref:Ribosomal protein L13 n=1 Tax=Aplanochytrium stocchinoi TaxID=215587 RepID=A0A7S3PSN3_9STRA|mmetsp:Transcript_19500/g.23712  ORF Transcript_19500/g.23712 Transcript_19500/m.23712 type:complete len:200 (+) Transcript_19500:142-741(+)|eukprot:CAMPEP_0204840622 /NCGR_PEP_ID=MMETSP1346-20131115/38315_1 /ASSEMBLY_ACC=CAM_ASM_000771 /TAXON_ID=215587 /ORGANISM="Aplanochytrium stocchinoi, Strain GSBS06" /LENGTH=199 /DNA_ID=CAMNT_0051978139 /DNA_START=320 /DNA_END=919 /DNA_ORIENTATION=-